ncbi:hypothetical protein ACMFMG_007039 [Clarireedia jacksonii]
MAPKKGAATSLRTRLPRRAKGPEAVSQSPKPTKKVTKKATKKTAPAKKLKPSRKTAAKSGTGREEKHVTIEERRPINSRGKASNSIVRQEASYPNPFSSESSRNSTASLYSKWASGLSTPYPRSSSMVSRVTDTTSPGFNEAMGFKYSPGFGGASGFLTKSNTGEPGFGAPSSVERAKPKPTGRTASSIAAENVSDFFTKLGSPSAPGFPSFEPGYPYPGNSNSWFSPQQYSTPWMQAPQPGYLGQTHDSLLGGYQPTSTDNSFAQGFGTRSNFPNPVPWSSLSNPPGYNYNYNIPVDFGTTSPADDVAGTSTNPTTDAALAVPQAPELGIRESKMTREKSMLVPGGRILKTTTIVFTPLEGGQQKNEREKGLSEDRIGISITDKDGNINVEEGGWLQALNRIEAWEVEALLDQNRLRYRKKKAAKNGIFKKPVAKKAARKATQNKSGPTNAARKSQQEEAAADSAPDDRKTRATSTFMLGPNHPINQNPPKAKPLKKAPASSTPKPIPVTKGTTQTKRVTLPEHLTLRKSRRTSRAPSRYSPMPAETRPKLAAVNTMPGPPEVSRIGQIQALPSPPFTATPQEKTTSSELNRHLASASRLAMNVLNRTSRDLITDLQNLTSAMDHANELRLRKTSAPLRADPKVTRRRTAIQETIQRAFEASIERAVSKAAAIERKRIPGASDALCEFKKYYTAMIMLRNLQLQHVYGTKYVVQVDVARQKMKQSLKTAVMEHLTVIDITTEQMENRRGKTAAEAGERFQEEFKLVAALREMLEGFEEVFAFERRIGIEEEGKKKKKKKQDGKTKKLVERWRKLYGDWTVDDWAGYGAERAEDDVAFEAVRKASLAEKRRAV